MHTVEDLNGGPSDSKAVVGSLTLCEALADNTHMYRL